jgi:hypothetical protein
MYTAGRIQALGATQIAVGLSATVKVLAGPYVLHDKMKIVSGAGTLWVSPVPAALSGASALIAVGYPVGATEVVDLGGASAFYLSAAAATMTVAVEYGLTAGATFI